MRWAVGSACLLGTVAAGDVINVPGDFPTIQAAIDDPATGAGDVIVVAPGLYPEEIDFLGKAITVRSAEGPAVTTIEGDFDGTVVTCASGEGPDTVLDGFTVTNGNATYGGGMYLLGATPTVTGCIFTLNNGTHGGGMYCDVGSAPTVSRCLFVENSGASGAGMYNNGSDPNLVNCRFVNNLAGSGAGLYNNDSNPRVTNCSYLGNRAAYGGGIYNFNSSPIVANSTFVLNYSSASFSGGGAMTSFSGSPTLTNCVLWDNQPPPYQIEGPATVSYSDVEFGWSGPGVGNISVDPVFVSPDGPIAENDYRLAAGSPCIDAGASPAVPSDVADLDGDGVTNEPTPLDLADAPRFQDDPDTPDTGLPDLVNPIVDMGAYEFQPCPADTNDDGQVNINDFLGLIAAWGTSDPDFDIVPDGTVDLLDFQALLAAWGPCP